MTTLSMCEHILIQAIGVALYLFTPLWAHLVTLCRLGPKSASVNKIDRFNMSDGMILVTLIAVATTLATNAPIDRYRQNWLLLGSLNLFVILNGTNVVSSCDARESLRINRELRCNCSLILAQSCLRRSFWFVVFGYWSE